MKLPLSTIIAVALSLGVVWAEGPVEKAGDVAENAVDTAKNVGHKVVKGTKEVVHKVVGAVTPDPDADERGTRQDRVRSEECRKRKTQLRGSRRGRNPQVYGRSAAE